jgi:Uncharacterized conserved protein
VAFNDLPVVIADPADNAGGGAPSDNTEILQHLIDSKVENACIGPIWDPIAVRICFDAGLGARSTCGSAARSPSSGQPVDAEVDIIGLKRDAWQLRPHPGAGRRLCRGAGGRRRRGADHQPHAGHRPRTVHQSRHRSDQKKIVVVKSTNHFMAAYGRSPRR